LLASLKHLLAPHCLHSLLRLFVRSLAHSGAHGNEVFVYKMNASISNSSSPLCIGVMGVAISDVVVGVVVVSSGSINVG